MGYTTEFKGQFTLNKQLNDFEIVDTLTEWADGKGPCEAYCQWELTKDRKAFKWDNNEKFYDYQNWLQHIIDDLLLPKGYSLSGEVEFQGEEIGDHGWLYIEDNKVKKRKTKGKIVKCPHCRKEFLLEKKEDE